MPLHSSSGGKLFLAYLDEGERDRILRSLVFAKFTTRTISDIRTMTEELRRVREQGYATDEEETREGISSLSTPIIDDEGEIVAALAIFGNSSDFSAERTSEVQYLKEKAVFISRQIGYVGGRIAF
jgi:DNA-binding IclR family transcriptional regulator